MAPPIVVKIVNVFAFIFLLGYNSYAGLFGEPDNSPYHNTHPNYFTPACFVYGVWALIHVLLLGFVIYQFFPAANEVVYDGIHWHFLSINVWNSVWLFAYETNHTILAIIPILFLLGQVSYVYGTIKFRYPAQTWGETLWIHAPFSLFHGWAFVLTILSLFVAFSQEKVDDGSPSILTKILVFFGLAVLESVAVGYIEKCKGDITGAIVIDLTLYGIAVEQDDPFIRWTAIIFGVITSFHILKPIVNMFLHRRREEGAPLLG
ncbi:6092_t:CDS:2 [Diversispora eburnea]|uniref:6092_t:CDS:1 n=1 Tax=Diversispora eburnea TaxID=1213867 RepID=A0A9N9CM68_9GLOM|nr:6092_t:CDS:2 [Diversispora eburnea]